MAMLVLYKQTVPLVKKGGPEWSFNRGFTMLFASLGLTRICFSADIR